ncbi:MAG: peptidoglycan-associated lipoprotein Pal [Desulfomonilaceae bacterium]
MIVRYVFRAAMVLILACFVVSGCSRKIVKPGPVGQGPVGPLSSGQIAEQELQTMQAELKIVYFDFDKYTLSPEAQSALQYNAELLKRAPQVQVTAEGHCDERGTAEYNLALGERRARAVMDFLVSLGIAPQRIQTVSYGSECPVDPGHNEQAWAKNRRVFLRVSR